MHELEVLLSRLKMEHLSYRGKRRLQHRLADPEIPERIVDTKYGGRYP